MADGSRIIAVIGAECTGKTTLAAALAEVLPGRYVHEQLRLFVREHGRPPLVFEQAALMQRQIDAAAGAATAISDGGAIMTAVYSVLYYGDESLVDDAVRYHREECALTVWCGTDIAWRADPGQRDGPEYRERADRIIAGIVPRLEPRLLRVSGDRQQRIAAVLAAVGG